MTLLVFLIILSFLVFVHELGHFVMARRAGVKVEEFGFGYPPRAFTFYTDKHGTEYTVNWLPFGGFVRMKGEDAEVSEGMVDEEAFYSKKKRSRLGIIVAGALMNFIFGAIAFGAIYTITGIPTNLEHVVVEEALADSPAAQGGLVQGDVIVAIETAGGERRDIKTVAEFIEQVDGQRGSEIGVVLENGERRTVYVRKLEEVPEGQGALGVVITDFEMKHYPIWQMPFMGMWVGIKAAFAFGIFLLGALGGMLRDLLFSGIVPKDVAGPVGIVHMAQKENLLTSGWISILNFSAILSINLGVVNLLPFPALDGGRAVFVLLEGIVGKNRLSKFERYANMAGMALLLTLIVLVSIRDVRVWVGESAWWQQLMSR